ncbi:ParB/RepB/Spo0J family partition protein [Bacteroidota bacterium]
MDKKARLGKGLSALFDEKNVDVASIPSEQKISKESIFFDIDINSINLNPFQPREDFNEEKLKELSESIKHKGIIQPITVKIADDDKSFDLITGERRVRAAKMIGIEKIPAYVYKEDVSSSDSMLELALIENIQREDLNPIELSNSYQKLLDEYDFTQEQIAEKVSKKRSTVANYLRLQRLPAEIKVSLRKNEISEAHARMLLRVENVREQIELWRRVISEKLSVRKLEDLTKEFTKQKKNKVTKLSMMANPFMKTMEDKLRRFFGTKVRIKNKTRDSGEITIEYYSNDDLERIMDKCDDS